MGQPVHVISKRSPRPGVIRYEIDRSLTGMAHETYDAPVEGDVVRPPDVLAKRLFETGAVSGVHVFSNLITVTTTNEGEQSDIDTVIEDLFLHYLPGVMPTAV